MKWRLADCHYFCFDVSKGSQSFLSVRTRPLLLFLVFFFISIFKRGWVSTSPRTEIFDFRSVLILFFSLFFFKWRSKRTAQRQGPRYPTADVTILRFLRSRGRKLWLIAKTRQDTKKKKRKKTALQQSLDGSVTRRRLWFRQQWASSTYQTRRKGGKKKKSGVILVNNIWRNDNKKKKKRTGRDRVSVALGSHFTTEWRDFVTAAH